MPQVLGAVFVFMCMVAWGTQPMGMICWHPDGTGNKDIITVGLIKHKPEPFFWKEVVHGQCKYCVFIFCFT